MGHAHHVVEVDIVALRIHCFHGVVVVGAGKAQRDHHVAATGRDGVPGRVGGDPVPGAGIRDRDDGLGQDAQRVRDLWARVTSPQWRGRYSWPLPGPHP